MERPRLFTLDWSGEAIDNYTSILLLTQRHILNQPRSHDDVIMLKILSGS